MRIIFMGTPGFAIPALTALIASAHEVIAVYTQPPRPSGRGMKLTASPVQQLAEQHAIPVFTPTSLKHDDTQRLFAAHQADVAVVAAYGLLLPQAILDAPRLGCINIHPSDLPRWRGAAPIQRTIMAGDTTTACCIMQMDKGLDSGAVLARQPYTIAPGTTSAALHDAMAELGAKMLMEVLSQSPIPNPQPLEGVTYANKITNADQPIDWTRPAAEIYQHILGLFPAPGATTTINSETIKIFAATVEKGDTSKPGGIILDDRLLINAGDGLALRIIELQRPNKSRQTATQFLQGFPVSAGIYAKSLIPNA
jgi:methionyl-tRNA formyltransferase